MQDQLLKIFEEFEVRLKNIIVQTDISQNIFHSVLKATFVKIYEFNCLCNKLSSTNDSFFQMATLRGICEDLISIKFLKEKILIDRDLLLSHMVQKGTFEDIIVQQEFFKENKPAQMILDSKNAETLAEELSKEIKLILKKNGLKGDREFPSVAQMATDTKLIKLYNYLYYATSTLVHFSPSHLMRLGWTDSKTSNTFRFSTKYYNKYYFDFCSYYAAFLFVEFYKSFKKDLKLEKILKVEIIKIKEQLENKLRMPEIVTFEEINIKPPSLVAQLISKSIHRLSNK